MTTTASADLRGTSTFREDPWLSGIFGRKVFELVLSSEEMIDFSQRELEEMSEESSAFCFARVATDRLSVVRLLTGSGFNVVDVNITLERKPSPFTDSSPARGLEVRDVEADDAEALLSIAGTSFTYSRFHVDPLVPNSIANEVKRAWIESYLERRRGERLLVCEREGVVAGFLAVLRTSSDGAAVRVIDLVGVARAHQGFGIGTALVESFIGDSYGVCDLLRVSTQVGNVPSMRLYERSGFRMAKTAYVLHAHIAAGQVRK
ncbi:MAG TPA: GNAT family N-acetyltransferase [Blastocatellia bacterium]|jgi:ribosomal protein S18 acetylase RimI-like enzyme|nr:GNAT family N-acetyltransferase [Blastocatellia bacterium]